MGDGEHDAIFRAFERNGVMHGTRIVREVFARVVFTRLIAIAALKDQDFFHPDVTMSRIAASRLHTYEDSAITRHIIAPQDMEENAFVSGGAPLDSREIKHNLNH